MASEEKSPPSLQELCEKMSLQEVLPKASFAEFAALEPRLQQLLYNALQEEVTRLREVKQKWEDFKNYCPRTDLQLLDNLGRTEAADGGTEGYRLSDEFRSKWTYRSEGVRAHWVHGTVNPDVPVSSWGSYDLFRPSPDADYDVIDRAHAARMLPNWNDRFYAQISSQLFYYRVTATFGMPPAREVDGYKVCWETELEHASGNSVLSLYDYKGSASLQFHGSPAASKDALALVNFLLSMKCLHTYDGIVAGTVA